MNLISEITKKMIEFFDGDVIRVNHALKVYGFAKSIGELENLPYDKLQILEAASILHDIGIPESIKKYNSSAGKYQELEGPPIALNILKEFNLSSDLLERICYIIGSHHSYNKIDDIDFQILVEADFLVNIYEGDLDLDEIQSIRQKYFKTNTGISFLDSLYHKDTEPKPCVICEDW